MTDYCQYKKKTGKNKGKRCLEDAYRTADGEHAAEVKGGKAVFCHEHSPPRPPPMLDTLLMGLEEEVRRTTKALTDVSDDQLRAAVEKAGDRFVRGRPSPLITDAYQVRSFGLADALDELKKRLDIAPVAVGGSHHDMRNGVRVKGSHDPLWKEITQSA